VFGLRGKTRSELRLSAGPLDLSTGLAKTASSISVPYARGSRVDAQFQHWKSLQRQARPSWLLNNPEPEASESSTSSPDAFSHRVSTQRLMHVAPSLRSPRFPSEIYRPIPYTNLLNSVLGHKF
jgi:hypothetical protein